MGNGLLVEIRILSYSPPLMGGDKGEGGNISPSPRLPFKVFQQRQASSPTRGEDVEVVSRWFYLESGTWNLELFNTGG